MTLSAKSVRIFSAVEALREGQQDIRHALLPIFAPDFGKFDGELYDPAKIAAEVNVQYRLNVTPDILEQFTPIFVEKGWLTEITPEPNLSYRVTCKPEETKQSRQIFEENATSLGKIFKQFASELSPLIQIDTTEENLIDILVDWLVSLDIYTDDDITKLRRIETQGRKITYSVDYPGERAASEEHYLAARFVSHLIKSRSEYVPFLTELGSVGLITDVVRDFQKPSDSVKKTDLSVYLDAPVALDYLGLSGESARDNIDTILSRVKNLGGNIRIFRLSVEEMQTSLRALLQRSPADRTGPTAKALQRQEVVEAFVRQVATSPDGIIQRFGIGIVDQQLDAFPNEHKFFPNEATQELYSQIRWVDGDAPRWHDAAATAMITRKRAGTRSNDLFATKHVLITRNPFFGPRARRFCLDKSFIGPNHVGPVVHQREFATGVWLRAGLGRTDQEVPRKYILSACQRVLTITKSMVTRVREVSRHLTEPQKAQLELVLSEGRATQVLMDKTLGATSVIDSSNVEALVAEMKRSIGKEAYAEAAELVSAAKAQGRKMAGEHRQQLADAHNSMSEQRTRADETEARLTAILNSAVSRVNRTIGRKRLLLYAGFVSIFLASQVGAAVANLFSGQTALIITGVAIILATVVQFVKPIRERIIDPLLEAGDWKTLDTHSKSLSLGDIRNRVSYEGGHFTLTQDNEDQADQPALARSRDLLTSMNNQS